MAEYRTTNREIAALFQSVAAAQQRRDTVAMTSALEKILKIEPGNPAALNSLGVIALDRRDFVAADMFFAGAAAADPDAGALWMNLANAKRGRGDMAGEHDALLRVLQIDQRDLMATIRLAELHERRGDMAQANGRWAAVLAIVQMLPERPSGIEQVVAHAQQFVLDRNAQFGDLVDQGLDGARSSLDASDRRRFDACIDTLLGRRRLYVSDCAGMRFPFLPADEFFDRRLTPWLADIEAHTSAIRAECAALLDGDRVGFEPYVAMDKGTPDNKWTALDHSLDWSARYLWRYGERIDAACAACPKTADALASMPMNDMPRRGPTAFFSVLRPHTRLPAHSGVSNARAIVHLPLIVPPRCGFRVGGETREWVEGQAFAFDDTIEHEAWNDSDSLRAVLIFDVWNPHITTIEQDLLRQFFAIADASGHDPSGAGAVSD